MATRNPRTLGETFGEFKTVEDEIGRREIEVAGSVFTAIATDPFGFFHVKSKKGPVPKELSGQYTSAIEAERAITIYMNKKTPELKAE